MKQSTIVTDSVWLEARLDLLKREKEFSRLQDQLTEERRNMPWRRIESEYELENSSGPCSLADLFGDCDQLLIYHFMFGPEWTEGCKICSMFTDSVSRMIPHLAERDVSLVLVSRGPLEKLQAFRKRMQWDVSWVSSLNSDFNRDFNVSFTEAESESGEASYNFRKGPVSAGESPGISCFAKNEEGEVFHTYSAYARGLENLMGIYRLLDIVPKGRDEQGLPWSMAWVNHRDQY